MMIPILFLGVFAGAINALVFGLASGSLLVALLAYTLTGVGAVVLLLVALAVRYEHLCSNVRTDAATVPAQSLTA